MCVVTFIKSSNLRSTLNKCFILKDFAPWKTICLPLTWSTRKQTCQCNRQGSSGGRASEARSSNSHGQIPEASSHLSVPHCTESTFPKSSRSEPAVPLGSLWVPHAVVPLRQGRTSSTWPAAIQHQAEGNLIASAILKAVLPLLIILR